MNFHRPAGSPLSSPTTAADCLTELPWIYERRTGEEARQDLKAWLSRWEGCYAKLCPWVEDNIEETQTFYALPLVHRKHLKSTSLLQRLNEELKRRTVVVRIIPTAASCLRAAGACHRDAREASVLRSSSSALRGNSCAPMFDN